MRPRGYTVVTRGQKVKSQAEWLCYQGFCVFVFSFFFSVALKTEVVKSKKEEVDMSVRRL